jgi:uncharacterized protein
MEKISGRKQELELLTSLYARERSEFVAVFGRRRVGKTFLIRNAYSDTFTFQLTGLAKAPMRKQLARFHFALQKKMPEHSELSLPSNWLTAFDQLITYLEQLPQGKKVIFLDELPWLDTRNSDFVTALEHFWNSWASARADILLIVCGSAASWMIHKLLRNTGGLYNRVTQRIKLEPFTLAECEVYLRERGAIFTRYQLIQLYMVMGGIPFYLEKLNVQESALDNINRLCFKSDGLLREEFSFLYASLFNKAERHIVIVEVLAQLSKGMTRDILLKKAKIANGGTATKILEELEESGFIRSYQCFGKSQNDTIYQLSDFYTLFFLKFIRSSTGIDDYVWTPDAPQFQTWSGYAFEQIGLHHIRELKRGLQIGAVPTKSTGWIGHDGENGAQIDLVIDRKDDTVHLCEFKFASDTFVITKAYADALRAKAQVFQKVTKTKKAIFLTLISTYGLSKNSLEHGVVHQNLTMDVFFNN